MNQPTPKDMPTELWMLWGPDAQDWVVSFDDAPDGETYLVALTEDEAKEAAKHQNEQYAIDCFPVCVLGVKAAKEAAQ